MICTRRHRTVSTAIVLFVSAVVQPFLGSVAVGQPLRLGTEFQVNTYTPGSQYFPRVAAGAAGDFVVVWWGPPDGYQIFGQRFDSGGNFQGTEFQVNTTLVARTPDVAKSADGDFVVVWVGPNLLAQRFASSGAPNGTEFQVNTSTNYVETPRVAADPAGNFFVVWQESGMFDYGIFGQRFDSGGAALGSEFQVNNTTNIGSSVTPSVAADGSGNFIVVWNDNDEVIRGQRIASGGSALGSEFEISVITSDASIEFTEPTVGADGPGDFVVAWRERDTYDVYFPSDVKVRRYSSTGAPQGTELQANDKGYFTFEPDIVVGSSGNFVVTWSAYQEGPGGVGAFARRFENSGSPVGDQFQVSAGTPYQQAYPVVALTGPDGFVVVWANVPAVHASPDILGQLFQDTVTTPICTAGTTIGDAQVKLSKLGAPSGDEKMLIKGALQFPPDFPADLDPVTNGAQLLIEDLGAGNAALFELSHFGQPVPGGSGCGPKDGWKANGAHTRFKYLNKTGAMPPSCTAGSANGLALIKLSDQRAQDGTITFKVKAKNATIANPVGPLRVTLVLGAGAAQSDGGECGAVPFGAGQCAASGSGFKCR